MPLMHVPLMYILPVMEKGAVNCPAIAFNKVDLPEPLGPMIESTSPELISLSSESKVSVYRNKLTLSSFKVIISISLFSEAYSAPSD